jgi:hypothetical protein
MLLLDQIAEPVPLELPMGHRTAKGDLGFAYPDHLPVSTAAFALDSDLLANGERVGLKNGDLMSHILSFTAVIGLW